MGGFDVLDRHLPLMRRCFLEASAGTGKTFAIETLFLRLLLQEGGPSIEEMVVVTFTKAATMELRARIRKRIEEVVLGVAEADFLDAIREQGGKVFLEAQKRAAKALAHFDHAQIFTIHSFCFKTLEEHPIEGEISLSKTEESQSSQWLQTCVKDHLRLERSVALPQWEILFSSGHDFERVVETIGKLIEKRLPIECGRSFEEIEREFKEKISSLALDPDVLFQTLCEHAACYKEMNDRQKRIKPEIIKELKTFAEGCAPPFSFPFTPHLLKMSPENLLKGKVPPEWNEWSRIEKEIFPLIAEACDEEQIIARLAEGARGVLERSVEREELHFFHDLLLMMHKRVQDARFAENIRSRYKAVFIDEFQDTDPLQWEIFSTLFNKEKYSGALYLIGDPKQSIYRFRHADLYTFMEARESFERNERGDLSVNYRSNGMLIRALNRLLVPIPDFLTLPKTMQSERCPPLEEGPCKKVSLPEDGKGAIHFFEGEEEEYFPFIIEEIKRLHTSFSIPLNQFALLVRDRFQGEAFAAFAKKKGIPISAKRSRSLKDSKAIGVMEELGAALEEPHDYTKRGIVLAGPLFGFDEKRLQEKERHPDFFHLQHLLHTQGFMGVLEEIFATSLFFDLSLYGDLRHLAELLAEPGMTIEKVKAMPSDAECLEGRGEGIEGVQVMTIHVSKGLEFAVVFALGLCKGNAPRKEIVGDFEKGVMSYRREVFEAHLKELEAEKMRLIYVALTRAKERLYLPVLKKEKKNLSLMGTLLNKVLGEKPLATLFEEESGMTWSDCKVERETPFLLAKASVESRCLPALSLPERFIRSFSSLAPPLVHTEAKKEDGVPQGKEFGLFLHTLFENVFREDPGPFVEKSPYGAWKKEILEMVEKSLSLPLEGFSLNDVDPKKMWHELEFLYPTGGGDFMKGFIDLLFEHNGKVYLVDWKSNLLEGYTPLHLEEAMKKHDYFLQARIYREGVERYLKVMGASLDFGGAFYLFVRGPAVYVI